MKTIPPLASESIVNCTREFYGIKLDFAKQRLTRDDFAQLIQFGQKKKLLDQFNAMRRGEIVNVSEGRAALHTSLRDPSPNAP